MTSGYPDHDQRNGTTDLPTSQPVHAEGSAGVQRRSDGSEERVHPFPEQR